MNGKLFTVIGALLTLGNVGLSIATDKYNEKKLDDKIAEKVAKALTEKTSGKEA